MFAFARPGRIQELLETAGFDDVEVSALPFEMSYTGPDQWWETSLALGRPLADAVQGAEPQAVRDVRAGLAERARRFSSPDGSLLFGAHALVAAAGA